MASVSKVAEKRREKARELYEAIRRVDKLKQELWKELPQDILEHNLDFEETRGLLIRLGDYKFAVPITTISQVVRAAALSPSPQPSKFVLGMLNLHGNPLPVLDLHKLMDLDSPPLEPSQVFVVLEIGDSMVSLRVDDISNLVAWRRNDLVSPGKFLPYMPNIKAVVLINNCPVAILDVPELITRANIAMLLK